MAYTFTKRYLEVIQQNKVTMKLVNKTYYNIFLYYEQMYNRTAGEAPQSTIASLFMLALDTLHPTGVDFIKIPL